jgi:RHS repeat-associated protein
VLAGPDARACKSENDLQSVTVRFRYDARNRRVGRQDGTGPWKQYVFTTAGVLLAEMTKPTTSGGAWSTQREYVWLDGRPLAQIEYPGPAGGNEGHVYLVHVDYLGQPRSLTTTTNTTVWAASAPRPYGDIDEATAVDPVSHNFVSTNLRLPGQYDERLLGSIGLKGPFYNHYRWYLPSLARYMELDPIALKGGLNGRYAPDWYGYGNANPVRWTDQLGLTVFLAGGYQIVPFIGGREAYGGIYSSSDGSGLFSSIGNNNYGLLAGAGVSAGYIRGDTASFAGPFTNGNLVTPWVSVSIYFSNGDLVGFGIGVGPGIGYATTKTNTQVSAFSATAKCK